MLSNRVALCQPTLILKDIHNGNISLLPPRCLKHLFYIKPWKGFMPRPATAPQICWMEVPPSTTQTPGGGSAGAHCTPPRASSAPCPPPRGHVPPTCPGQAWRCSWRPGVAPLAPHILQQLPTLPQPYCRRGCEPFAPPLCHPLQPCPRDWPLRPPLPGHPGDSHPDSGHVTAWDTSHQCSAHLSMGAHRGILPPPYACKTPPPMCTLLQRAPTHPPVGLVPSTPKCASLNVPGP